ncbi:MAG TPA: glycine dehydrogenase (aminomethyl-transferring), partial [Mycobacteriales bacterium]|nr:glycine dehydrogenase (aminomethyl-transferring) [Mycobacteriales bacterium]
MVSRPALAQLDRAVPFVRRHIGPTVDEQAKMLAVVGYASLDELTDAAVPEVIRAVERLTLPAAVGEDCAVAELRERAAENRVLTPMIGLGYHDTVTPPVIRRGVLENPAWYTAYTPYQPEISQGRLEALLTFQTVIADLTGLPVAGASMLDEATAAAEAMALCRRVAPARSAVFLVDADTHPQTLAVVETRARPLGITVVAADLSDGLPADLSDDGPFGVLLAYPGSSGEIRHLRPLVAAAQARGAVVAVACDLLALTLLTPPGEFGA